MTALLGNHINAILKKVNFNLEVSLKKMRNTLEALQ